MTKTNGPMLNRRGFVAAAGGAAMGLGLAGTASAQPTRDFSAVEAALAAIPALDGNTSYLIRGGGDVPWQAEHRAQETLFVGSAVKTFILTRYLKDVEEGRLSLTEPVAIDDGVRSLSSPVYLGMTGRAPARSILEAMITHSDNTATDAALAMVGVDRVRAFIAEAGLTSVRVPTSTRQMFSYLAGAEPGVDMGWPGMLQIADDEDFGEIRSAINDEETFLGSAADFVSYYERAVAGEFFEEAASLTEFLRIQSMADAISFAVPRHHAAYAKGGSIEWNNFNALCLPGQMRVTPDIPVTFCFTLNWDGGTDTIGPMSAALVSAIAGALGELVTALS